jgi:hypothetical protein
MQVANYDLILNKCAIPARWLQLRAQRKNRLVYGPAKSEIPSAIECPTICRLQPREVRQCKQVRRRAGRTENDRDRLSVEHLIEWPVRFDPVRSQVAAEEFCSVQGSSECNFTARTPCSPRCRKNRQKTRDIAREVAGDGGGRVERQVLACMAGAPARRRLVFSVDRGPKSRTRW